MSIWSVPDHGAGMMCVVNSENGHPQIAGAHHMGLQRCSVSRDRALLMGRRPTAAWSQPAAGRE
jgi:hypothetical protein